MIDGRTVISLRGLPLAYCMTKHEVTLGKLVTLRPAFKEVDIQP